MSRYRPRVISQATRAILADIHREAERQRQIDRGLGYRAHALDPQIKERPLHIGPAIEAVKIGEEWAA